MRIQQCKIMMLAVILLMTAGAEAKDFAYNAKGNRDPFVPLVTPDGRILAGAKHADDSGDVVLEGIMWDPQGASLAIINGKPVAERERILNMQILKIKRESVLVQKEGKVMEINLQKRGEER